MTQTVHIPLYTIRHGQIGGTEFAIYNLLRGLAATGTRVRLSYGRNADLSPNFLAWANGKANVTLQRTGGLPGPKAVRFMEEMLFQSRRRDDNWAIYPNYFCPPSLSERGHKSCVILHDIQYKRYPAYHSAKRRAWLDFYLPRMFRTATSIVLISQSELALVREYFGNDAASRCDVVHNAIDFSRLEQGREALSEHAHESVRHPYILSVCHQFPHKNVITLLKAFAQVAQRDASLRLYLVGSATDANKAFVSAALPAAIRHRVRITGFVSDAELGLFYANARLFVLPSLYEGFGMPAVEALGLGAPTLVGNAYALPEITLGYATLVDDLLDAEAWAAAIETAIRSGARPSEDQVAHVRATYDPATIARTLLASLRSREPDD